VIGLAAEGGVDGDRAGIDGVVWLGDELEFLARVQALGDDVLAVKAGDGVDVGDACNFGMEFVAHVAVPY